MHDYYNDKYLESTKTITNISDIISPLYILILSIYLY